MSSRRCSLWSSSTQLSVASGPSPPLVAIDSFPVAWFMPSEAATPALDISLSSWLVSLSRLSTLKTWMRVSSLNYFDSSEMVPSMAFLAEVNVLLFEVSVHFDEASSAAAPSTTRILLQQHRLGHQVRGKQEDTDPLDLRRHRQRNL